MTTLRQIAQVANQGSVCLRSLANANKIQPCLRNVIQHLTVKTFSAQVTTPSPEALGGSVSLTIRGDGSYDLTVHLHDSGLPDYSFRLVGVAASAVLFKTRKLHEDEIAEADKVFLGTVPYDAVTVCNASGPNGNCFAAPGPTGNYLIGANQWFDSLVADDTSKHTLIHELTHVWQMAHTPSSRSFHAMRLSRVSMYKHKTAPRSTSITTSMCLVSPGTVTTRSSKRRS